MKSKSDFAEDSFERDLAYFIYEYLRSIGEDEVSVDWSSVERYFLEIHGEALRVRHSVDIAKKTQKLLLDGWISAAAAENIVGAELFEFVKENSGFSSKQVFMFEGDLVGTVFYRLDEIQDKEKVFAMLENAGDLPRYSTREACELLGLATPKFLSLSKNAGIEPMARGRGYFYTLNQLENMKEFYRGEGLILGEGVSDEERLFSLHTMQIAYSFDEFLRIYESELTVFLARPIPADGREAYRLRSSIGVIEGRIQELKKFQNSLFELGGRFRLWLGHRSPRSVVSLLEAKYGSAISVELVEYIAKDFIFNFNKHGEFYLWLRDYLVLELSDFPSQLQMPPDIKDFPQCTDYRAGKELGITGQRFTALTKKLGISASSGWPARFYSINQIDEVREFMEVRKA